MAEDTGKRYYWLKLQDDFFSSKRIKKLRKIAGGDTYTIIYLKMQLMAMKNNGVLVHTGLEETFAEELALDLDEEADNVAVTVNYLLSCGLLETEDDTEYFLPYVLMNTGKEGASAKRVREYRERKALQCNAEVTGVKQIGNGEKETKKEQETREDSRDTGGKPAPPYQQIVDLYHSICKSFPAVRSLSDARKKAIKSRLTTYTVEDFKKLFEMAEASSFLKGEDGGWRASFDWLIKESNMLKVLEGNYTDKPKRHGRKEIVPEWMGGGLDMEGFEKDLLNYRPKYKPKTAAEDEEIQAKADALRERIGG